MIQVSAVDCIRPSLLTLHPYDAVIPQNADKLDANEFPLDLPEWFKKKLSLVWEKGIPANRYPDATHRSLKQSIGYYVGVSPDHIALGNGSDELIRSLLIMSCLENRGAILVSDPTFSMYTITARTLGIPTVNVPRNPETMGLDLALCQEAVAHHPIRVVFVVSPNSPTGNGVTPEEWQWIRSLPPEILVVVDEAYFEFSKQTVVQEALGYPNWVVLRTFSKAFRLATHRVGYAVAHSRMIEILDAIRLPYNLPMFSQWAVQLALDHAEELLAGIPEVLQERDRVYQRLTQIPGLKVWPSVANFLFFRGDTWDPAQVQKEWLLKGSCVRHTGNGLRLTIGTKEENDRSLQRLETILLA
jgi:histidinol-phosphate aminotransferase